MPAIGTEATVATLDDLPILGPDSLTWPLVEGIAPAGAAVLMSRENAQKVLSGALRPSTLLIVRRNGGIERREEYRNLYATRTSPGEDPYTLRVHLSDRRWLWNRVLIHHFWNVRRNIGFKRVESADGVPELTDVRPEVWYYQWSLQPGGSADTSQGRPVTADEALAVLAEELIAYEREHVHRGAPGFVIAPGLGSTLKSVPFESFPAHGQGDEALGQVLAYLPEAKVFVDPDGTLVFRSKLDGAEEEMVKQAGNPIVGQGFRDKIKYARERARKYIVYFTRQIDMRIECQETEQSGIVDTDGRVARNVLALPDFAETIGGRLLVQGSWTNLSEYLSHISSAADVPGVLQLTIAKLRRLALPWRDPWAPLLQTGQIVPDRDWATRLSAIAESFRRIWQVPPRFMDRIQKLIPERAAIIDPVTGTRARAIVYADYCTVNTQWAMIRERLRSGSKNWGDNVKGYPNNTSGPNGFARIDETAKPAPARIEMLDHDQGVFRVTFNAGVWGEYQRTLPGMLEEDGTTYTASGYPVLAGPTGKIEDFGRAITFDALGRTHKPTQFTAEYTMAAFFSAIPGAPNDKRQFHRIEISPGDIAELLPPGAREGLRDAKGPPVEIYIGADVEVARVAWSDDRFRDIEKAFGLGSDNNTDEPNLTGLVINDAEQDIIGQSGASLPAIARAAAAAYYASTPDRYEGNFAVDYNPSLRPTGFVEEVAHEVDGDGVVLTRLRFASTVQRIRIESFLGPSTRRVMMRLAGPGGAQ